MATPGRPAAGQNEDARPDALGDVICVPRQTAVDGRTTLIVPAPLAGRLTEVSTGDGECRTNTGNSAS